jgi:putative ABC transport system permease protein
MKFPPWRRRREEELEEEIQSHLRMAIRDRMERGENADEAESAARREFGNVGLIKETARGMWGFAWLETLWQDLRYGARTLLKQPGFTLMAILTLALGIGANTAIFSVVKGALLRPPVLGEPERLLRILNRGGGNYFSFPNYRDLAAGTPSFSMLAAHCTGHMILRRGDSMAQVWGEFVTGNFFPALEVRAALGRTFGTEADDATGASPVVVLSHGLWRRRFGADPEVVGKVITLNGEQFTVIGVMPEGFRGTWPLAMAPELWAPLALPQLNMGAFFFGDRNQEVVNVFGRLKPEASPTQAQAEVSLGAGRLAKTYPALNPEANQELEGSRVYPIDKLPEFATRALSIFLGLVTVIGGLLLLLVCANVANLLLSRALLRRQEVAIRLALGAGRLRLIRQLLTESALLALAGGAVGCLLTFWTTSLLRSQRLPSPPIEINATLDSRALVFTLAVSALAGVLFGLAPALHATKFDLVPMLKDDRRGGGGRAALFSLRNLLVVSQVTISLVLLICAGLFTRSLQNANNVDPGFETERMLTVSLDLDAVKYDETRGRLFYRHLLDQFERAPGVRQVSLAEIIPLTDRIRGAQIAIEGTGAAVGDSQPFLFNTVGPRYFETMGIPLLAGREFSQRDDEGAAPVVIINETMARRFWPGPQLALGRRVRIVERDNVLGPYHEVVGVVKDIKYRSFGEEPRAFFYVSALQNYRQHMALHVRTAGDPNLLRGDVRDRILALNKNLLVEVATIRENMAMAFLPARVAATVLGLVGVFGLSLAVVGIYGVVSYAVSQRTGEIGLRMALGAESRDILRLIIRKGMALTLIGVGLGAALSLAVTRLLSRILIGVSAADPLTFLAVTLLLTTVALIACWIPARRATKVDPMIALRRE